MEKSRETMTKQIVFKIDTYGKQFQLFFSSYSWLMGFFFFSDLVLLCTELIASSNLPGSPKAAPAKNKSEMAIILQKSTQTLCIKAGYNYRRGIICILSCALLT